MSRTNSFKRRCALAATLVILLALILGMAVSFSNRLPAGPRLPIVTLERSDGDRLLVDGKPFLIRGVCYNPIPIGANYEYDLWNEQSPALVIDGPLMAQMNVNTVRVYHPGKNPAEMKKIVNGLYQRHGIHTLLGHHLGFWAWPPVNYADSDSCERVKQDVLEMVRTYKNEPGILGWILGNENNYAFDLDYLPWTTRCWSTPAIDALSTEEQKRLERARIYYSFVNDLAREIKKIDKRHPVIMAFGETRSLDSAAKYAPDVDVLGLNIYRGASFGNLFREIQQKSGKPMMLIEFGCDRFNVVSGKEDENFQAEFLRMQWRDILRNSAAVGGARNCLGGTICEWTDEWWKGNESGKLTWEVQDGGGQWWNPAYYYDADQQSNANNMNEEWWGVVKLDPSRKIGGHNARVPTKAYRLIQQMWGVED